MDLTNPSTEVYTPCNINFKKAWEQKDWVHPDRYRIDKEEKKDKK